jgi:hypothetical protein
LDQNNQNCPFGLAVQLGVIVTHYPSDAGDLVSCYTMTGRSTYRIYVNPSIDSFEQEKAMFILLQHHKEAKGQDRQVTKSDLRIINKLVKKVRKIDEMVANIFLKGSIFDK